MVEAHRVDISIDHHALVGGRGETRTVHAQPPLPLPWGASLSEAVEVCRQWMVYLGALDAVASSDQTRNAFDLYSSRFLAWVENRQHNVDTEMVESVARVAAADGRYPLIFVPGGVLPTAQDRADELGVAILRFDARSADLDGANTVGRHFRARGLVVN